MVKIKNKQKSAAAACKVDSDQIEKLVKGIGAEAVNLKRTLDQLSCLRPNESNSSSSSNHGSSAYLPLVPLQSLSPVENYSTNSDFRGVENDSNGINDIVNVGEEDVLCNIQFRYQYGLRTAKWKVVDERSFEKVPFIALTKLDADPVLPLPPPPPPKRAFVRRDGTLVVVTPTGDRYVETNLELRIESPTKIGLNRNDGYSNAPRQFHPIEENRRDYADDSNEYHDDGAFDYGHYDENTNGGEIDTTSLPNGSSRVNVEQDINDDDDDDDVSSWDEESDDEMLETPVGVDVTRVELIKACPYCKLSFVGKNGKIIGAIFRRISNGDADFVEEHIDRCCLRQHMGELVKCEKCEKSYLKHPRKEKNHLRKYHTDDLRVCPFEQCSNVLLQSDKALIQHLTSAHYWSAIKSKSFVKNMQKKKPAKEPKKK